MVFTNWETTAEAMDEDSYQSIYSFHLLPIYSGQLAFWIKFSVQVITVLLYAWSLLAPLFIEHLDGKKEVNETQESSTLYTGKGRMTRQGNQI